MQELLKDIARAFASRNAKKLGKINNKILNEVIRGFDERMVELSIIVYALEKILSKRRFSSKEYKEHMDHIEKILEVLARKFDMEGIVELKKELSEMESRDPRYIFDLITKARIKMAATIYAKGVSLSKASKIYKVPKQEILSYAGKTMMFDRVKEEVPVKKRLKEAEDFFGGG